ncbi:heparan-alpha-glucosaminide N-acetyltransferase domain-containing protein [Zhihengliuella salsuginis]|uniref:Transporter n=1 Tax=Zhihengliuella salsuginis TaxID=578222 RepID=A0ABQ3GJJ2_9MICC|nr:heparan-alpha-glucosaminide N-acetyltransferase domain-containing protein [Zhihengliuella salsuginis]GHD07351.1 transporter [Zhihengliuella salsuginis]
MSFLRRTGKPRLAGVDAARGLALLGMMATHIVPLVTQDATGGYTPTWAADWFAGRASALFAVLAGVGLALLTGGARAAGPLGGARRGVVVRALLIAGIGLACGMLDTNVAVILTHYGLLFLAAVPFLGAAPRTLAAWAAGWLVLAPVVLYAAVPFVMAGVAPYDVGGSPVFADLTRPATLAADLLFTGYYPVVVWVGFLLVGLWAGRLDLSRPPIALALALGGAALAAVAEVSSRWLLQLPGAAPSLAAAAGLDTRQLQLGVETGYYFPPVVDSPWWFALAAPHTSAPLDLLHVTGAALATLGACQLAAMGLAALLGRYGDALLWPLTGAGTITLTLYVGHLIALDVLSDVTASMPRLDLYLWFAAACLVAGVAVRFLAIRGPLEAIVHRAASGVRRTGVRA